MNRPALLAQARKGIRAVIDNDREEISIARPAYVDDGFGGTMPGPTGSTVTQAVRISHRYKSVQELMAQPSGLDTGFGLFVLCDDTGTLKENDVFTARGRAWRVGPVNALIRFGGVIAYEAPLTEG